MTSRELLPDLAVVKFRIQPTRYEGSEAVRYIIDSDPLGQLPAFAAMDLKLPHFSSLNVAPAFTLLDGPSFTMARSAEGTFGTSAVVDPDDEFGWNAKIDLKAAQSRMGTYLHRNNIPQRPELVGMALRAELAADVVVSMAHIDWMVRHKRNKPRGHNETRMKSYGRKVLEDLMNRKGHGDPVFKKWRVQFYVLPKDFGHGGLTPGDPDPTLPNPKEPILTG